MSEPNDGGPAFPTPEIVMHGRHHQVDQTGMSLRDYFAGQALAALAYMSPTHTQAIVERCYAHADAMLAERAKRREVRS